MRSRQGVTAPLLAAACRVTAVLGAATPSVRADPSQAESEQKPPPPALDTSRFEKSTRTAKVGNVDGAQRKDNVQEQGQEQPSTDRYLYELKAPQVVHVYDTKTGLCTKPDLVKKDGLLFNVLRTIKEKTKESCNENEYCPENKKQLLLKAWAPPPGLLTRLTTRSKPGGTEQRSRKDTTGSSEEPYLCLEKDTFDELMTDEAIVKKYHRGSSGAVYGLNLTLPIKIRRATAGFNTTRTQNIEIGGLLGWRCASATR